MENINVSAIYNFLDNHTDIKECHIERCLYVSQGCEEKFIFEQPCWNGKRKTFVFVYNCGHFVECHTEYDTFNKHLLSAPFYDSMEMIRCDR